jgi:hypothetical protein
MKKSILIILCLCLFSLPAFAQGSNHRSAKARGRAKTVTATGCVRQGVECLILEPLSGSQKYSLPRNSKLKIGRAYRITGTLSDVSICMQGPHLNPRRITPLRIRCPKKEEGNSNTH